MFYWVLRRIKKNKIIMKKKYHIVTLGCAMNYSDSARVASFLDEHDYVSVSEIKQAELLIINTCGIRDRKSVV